MRAGRKGLYHKDCFREWQRVIGRERPELLGMATSLPVPDQRALGRRGRQPHPYNLKRNFRWLFLYRIGRHLGDDVSHASLALLGKQRVGRPSFTPRPESGGETSASSSRWPSDLQSQTI